MFLYFLIPIYVGKFLLHMCHISQPDYIFSPETSIIYLCIYEVPNSNAYINIIHV